MMAPSNLRKAHNVTSGAPLRLPYGGLRQLAELLGVTPSHLSHYLRGRPSGRIDRELRERFGIRREDLVPSRTIADAESGAVLDLPGAA